MRGYRAIFTSLLVVALAAFTPLQAADIEVEENPVPPASFGVASYKLEAGDAVIWDITPEPVKSKEYVVNGKSILIFSGPVNSKYQISAFIVNFETKKFTRKRVEVTVGKAPQPPPVDPPVEPVDPPVDPPTSYYFLIIQPDGPASPEYKKIMELPEWDVLRKGHKVKPVTIKEAASLNVTLPPNVKAPAVVTLHVSQDGKRSTIVREGIPLPTTGEAILKLPEVK